MVHQALIKIGNGSGQRARHDSGDNAHSRYLPLYSPCNSFVVISIDLAVVVAPLCPNPTFALAVAHNTRSVTVVHCHVSGT